MDVRQKLKRPFAELISSNPSLVDGTTAPGLGSLIDGKTLEHLPCASGDSRTFPACLNPGTLACSKCRLVKYCSKDCQRAHWKLHKVDCNSPPAASTWKPSWVTEKRSPAFLVKSMPGRSVFGLAGQYLWGNTSAVDVLNIPRNEGDAAISMDLGVCFAASGDIRNLVATVNGLPTEYRGLCTIVLNDINPYVTVRNLILLEILYDTSLTVDEAAELAYHIWYSALLTPRHTLYLYKWAMEFANSGWNSSFMSSFEFSTDTSRVQFWLPHVILEMAFNMISSGYSADIARRNMTQITLAASRLDYRDRRWAQLRPAHRVAEMKYRKDGLALPFGAQRKHFTQPNRFLFSEDGEWLCADNCSPLEGWNLRDVVASGARMKIQSEDIFGCLFAHVKGQLAEFTRRVRTLRVNISLFSMDANRLHPLITANPGNALPGSFRLDRIETSNLMDYSGLPTIISGWASLLNRNNPKATLLAYTMNWSEEEPGGAPETASPKVLRSAMGKAIQYRGPPGPGVSEELYSILMAMSLPAFHDSGPPFEEYLKKRQVSEEAQKHGIRRRTKHSIYPPTLGSTLTNPERKPSDLSKDEFYYIDFNGAWPLRCLEYELNM